MIYFKIWVALVFGFLAFFSFMNWTVPKWFDVRFSIFVASLILFCVYLVEVV